MGPPATSRGSPPSLPLASGPTSPGLCPPQGTTPGSGPVSRPRENPLSVFRDSAPRRPELSLCPGRDRRISAPGKGGAFAAGGARLAAHLCPLDESALAEGPSPLPRGPHLSPLPAPPSGLGAGYGETERRAPRHQARAESPPPLLPRPRTCRGAAGSSPPAPGSRRPHPSRPLTCADAWKSSFAARGAETGLRSRGGADPSLPRPPGFVRPGLPLGSGPAPAPQSCRYRPAPRERTRRLEK